MELSTTRHTDEYYMKKALSLAKRAAKIGEVPIGCVIVCNNEIVGTGYNKRKKNKTTLAQAELLAIDKASKKLGDWRLEGCTLYVTLEPCQMCAGAIVQARIDRVVIGAMNPKAGCAGSILNLLQMQQFNHAMDEIKEKTAQISQIIAAIDSIAFQTNILALNAAVEAARAGAAGKGFSVVADEVRSLAQKCAEAAKNTNELIDGTVTAVERGGHIANEGKAFFNKHDRLIIHFFKIICGKTEIIVLEAKPFNVLLDSLNVEVILFCGIGVIHTKIALAVIFSCNAKVNANSLCVTDV